MQFAALLSCAPASEKYDFNHTIHTSFYFILLCLSLEEGILWHVDLGIGGRRRQTDQEVLAGGEGRQQMAAGITAQHRHRKSQYIHLNL